MKINQYENTTKSLALLTSLLLLSSMTLASDKKSKNEPEDKDSKYDYAYIATSKTGSLKKHQQDLHLFVKSKDSKSINFTGKLSLPNDVKIASPFIDKNGKVIITLDELVSCTYSHQSNQLLLLGKYSFVECSNGLKANESFKVNKNIKVQFLSNYKLPSTAFAKVNVLERYVKGIKLPQLDASAGQILVKPFPLKHLQEKILKYLG